MDKFSTFAFFLLLLTITACSIGSAPTPAASAEAGSHTRQIPSAETPFVATGKTPSHPADYGWQMLLLRKGFQNSADQSLYQAKMFLAKGEVAAALAFADANLTDKDKISIYRRAAGHSSVQEPAEQKALFQRLRKTLPPLGQMDQKTHIELINLYRLHNRYHELDRHYRYLARTIIEESAPIANPAVFLTAFDRLTRQLITEGYPEQAKEVLSSMEKIVARLPAEMEESLDVPGYDQANPSHLYHTRQPRQPGTSRLKHWIQFTEHHSKLGNKKEVLRYANAILTQWEAALNPVVSGTSMEPNLRRLAKILMENGYKDLAFSIPGRIPETYPFFIADLPRFSPPALRMLRGELNYYNRTKPLRHRKDTIRKVVGAYAKTAPQESLEAYIETYPHPNFRLRLYLRAVKERLKINQPTHRLIARIQALFLQTDPVTLKECIARMATYSQLVRTLYRTHHITLAQELTQKGITLARNAASRDITICSLITFSKFIAPFQPELTTELIREVTDQILDPETLFSPDQQKQQIEILLSACSSLGNPALTQEILALYETTVLNSGNGFSRNPERSFLNELEAFSQLIKKRVSLKIFDKKTDAYLANCEQLVERLKIPSSKNAWYVKIAFLYAKCHKYQDAVRMAQHATITKEEFPNYSIKVDRLFFLPSFPAGEAVTGSHL